MEILNGIFWTIGVVAAVVAALLGIAWIIFYVTDTVTESRRQKTAIADRAYECHRWLSGFKDLDLIWGYIFGTGGLGISNMRDAYARERGTDVYGNANKQEERTDGKN